MNKMKMHSRDLIQDNIQKLKELFPNCVTESQDEETGQIVEAIDFDLLRQELSREVVEGPAERFRLDWPGKRKAMLAANAKITKTLRPVREESVDFDTTQNLFIEGDNLEALKLLQETYLGKVKMIYIDPPYNTGKDFIYKDNFKQTAAEYLRISEQVDEDGNRLVANTEANGRYHSDWLSMMAPRLKLARNLLSEDGVIFVSIDEGEARHLRKICDEIFGEKMFITNFLWQKKKKPSFLHKNIGSMYEYVVCYSKLSSQSPIFSVETTTEGKKYPLNNAGNSLNTLLFPPRSVTFSQKDVKYLPQDMSEGAVITELLDTVIVDNYKNKDAFRLRGEFRYSQSRLDEIISKGEILTISKSPFRPNHIKRGGESKKMHNHLTPTTYNVGTNEDGTAEFVALFDTPLFDNPKPTTLISQIIKATTSHLNGNIVLDFFAGSSTTAHAVMKLNAEDGGNRKFIMVQLPEDLKEKSAAYKAGYTNIANLSKERIRRAGKQIVGGGGGRPSSRLGSGRRVSCFKGRFVEYEGRVLSTQRDGAERPSLAA